MEAHPFERCLGRVSQLPNTVRYRLQLAQRYAYVYPAAHLLDAVMRYAPLVELGAGTGYWSYLLRLRGADIVAYDQAPPGEDSSNRYHYPLWPWSEVLEGDGSALKNHTGRTLLVCWPPLFSALGDVLQFFTGTTVIYIGDDGHRTAHLAGLVERFTELERYSVLAMDPSPGTDPHLSVWQRRTDDPMAASVGRWREGRDSNPGSGLKARSSA